MPGAEDIGLELARGGARSLTVDAADLGAWDSRLVAFILQLREWAQRQSVSFEAAGLPAGVDRLMTLARAVPAVTGARVGTPSRPLLARIGAAGQAMGAGARRGLAFLGEVALALGRLVRGRAQFRWSDAWLVMQQSGPQALGIVALINVLVGMILAFVGAVQLRQFGATIFVADLVAVATVREMGCIMTGIIVCGRTGAAFAAQLGTMKVNQEIDAFRTFGIPPVEFLVLPRVLALVAMMPLLVVFADLIAILGGGLVSLAILDVGFTQYVDRTLAAVTPVTFLLGVVKGGCFGVLVALAGCLRGLECGSNAAAVGFATTSAVVTGITAIIAADGLFAVLCNALGI